MMLQDRATPWPPAQSPASFCKQPSRKAWDGLTTRPARAQDEDESASDKSPARRSSKGTGESSAAGAKTWFDQSNARSGGRLGGQIIVDDDPPFFLRTRGSGSSNCAERVDLDAASSVQLPLRHGLKRAATSKTSLDDFRSVIDDLTIENKKLKERLRKYEATHCAHLNKDRLFEVRVHGLSAQKKRELEETLREFVSGVSSDCSSATHNSSRRRGGDGQLSGSLQTPSTHSSSTPPSNSRRADSAYVSGFTSWPASNRMGLDGRENDLPVESKVESFLYNTPLCSLAGHSTAMSKRMKKKLVVRRLEQLFTGKTSISERKYVQPMWRQELPKSVEQDARQANDQNDQYASGAVREAQILTPNMLQKMKSHILQDDSSDKSFTQVVGRASEIPPYYDGQRPTRPLDLDPDRAQIPSENIQYIRHLGLSSPKMTPEGCGDTDGWVYLNLLVNMAQLHIINVTVDFVRSAVAEASEKFQLSRDGRKVRWKGESEGTILSSDSDTESVLLASPIDSDSLDGRCRKRRKTNNNHHKVKKRKDSSTPISSTSRNGQSHVANEHHAFYFRPIFRHAHFNETDTMSSDRSSSDSSVCESSPGRGLHPCRDALRTSRSASSRRKRKDEGTIAFYSGAPFFTDLSGDHENIATSVHAVEGGKDSHCGCGDDGYGSGKPSIPVPSRTPSGSSLPFRPFKKSFTCTLMQEAQKTIQTPELLIPEACGDLDFSPLWTARGTKEDHFFQKFDASGLGGTRPADHFAVMVETRRMRLDGKSQSVPPKFSFTGLGSQKYVQIASKSTEDSVKVPEAQCFADGPVSQLAAMRPRCQPSTSPVDLPVKTEVLSTHVLRLRPSGLPPPAAYYVPYSSSDDGCSDNSTLDVFVEHLSSPRQRMLSAHRASNSISVENYHIADNSFDSDDEEGSSIID